jgi:hypothetical protein
MMEQNRLFFNWYERVVGAVSAIRALLPGIILRRLLYSAGSGTRWTVVVARVPCQA